MGRQAKCLAQAWIVPSGTRARALSAYMLLSLLALLLLSFLLSVNAASAAADIQGTENDLRVNARNATIVEILDALKSRFQFIYRVRSYNTQALTGIYSGSSLRQTLERVLDGNNYVLKASEQGLELVVLGASSQVSTDLASSRPAGAANPNPSLSPASPPPLSSYLAQNGLTETAAPTPTP